MDFIDWKKIKKDLNKRLPRPIRWGRNLYRIVNAIVQHRKGFAKVLPMLTSVLAALMEHYIKGGKTEQNGQYVEGENAEEINAVIEEIYAGSQNT